MGGGSPSLVLNLLDAITTPPKNHSHWALLTHRHLRTYTHTPTHKDTHTHDPDLRWYWETSQTRLHSDMIIWQHDSRLYFPSSHIFVHTHRYRIQKNEDIRCGPQVRLWPSERINYYYLWIGHVGETSKSWILKVFNGINPNASLQSSLQSHCPKTQERALPDYTDCLVALTGQLGDVCERLLCHVPHSFLCLIYTCKINSVKCYIATYVPWAFLSMKKVYRSLVLQLMVVSNHVSVSHT